jgi:hypothetical protein
MRLIGAKGLKIDARVSVPQDSGAGWRYADPDGQEHEVVNCSVAKVELDVRPPGEQVTRRLHTAHGGAYELGMRAGEQHGIPLAPFADG